MQPERREAAAARVQREGDGIGVPPVLPAAAGVRRKPRITGPGLSVPRAGDTGLPARRASRPERCHAARPPGRAAAYHPAVFLVLSKVLDWFAAPLSWALLLLGAAALGRRRARLAWTLAVLGALTLVVFASGPVANALERLTERGVRSTYRPEVVYDAVVVLGGMVDTAASR